MIRWLAEHRCVTILLTLGYVAFIVLGHDLMQRPALWVNHEIGDKQWNLIVAGTAVPLLLIACAWLMGRMWRHRRRGVALLHVGTTCILAVTSFFTLLQVNIEIIHFPQYLILALLIFALTGSFLDTMILATAVGIVDEGYQYFYLHRHWGVYFDFNDVVLNAIGVGMGLTALFVLQPYPIACRRGKKIAALALVTIAIGLILGAAGAIRTTRAEDPNSRVISLTRCPPSDVIWHTTRWGKKYHVLSPEWGLAITAALVVFYGALGAARSPRPSLLTPATGSLASGP